MPSSLTACRTALVAAVAEDAFACPPGACVEVDEDMDGDAEGVERGDEEDEDQQQLREEETEEDRRKKKDRDI
ncbi:hypothetical protein BDK51DRAFT_46098 [Blyttiomyces helicus]|uniref:Uncharacterized protein n=1 Tax=Blyttiomyces helicus TaxID=388810 RepID=A0A4P9WI74_9FUNG|nr:hypothetical protein BDK51DRAFT_46098 [Blyttiomyces helicus]|eukprot:RKO90256.1 hypothetical protein BDK51DRAFT_46098 [Blyttiomyces helicus]